MKRPDFWKQWLTPFDVELFVMVESLTERRCEPGLDHDGYFFEADYELHNDPQYILAIWDAIDGRLGKRLISIKDDPERHCLFVRVKFENRTYPAVMRYEHDFEPDLSVAQLYKRNNVEYRAMLVDRNNAEELLRFVGCGEMEIPKDGKAMLHLRNVGGMVFMHAPENTYVVHIADGHFTIIPKDVFEKEYARK